MQEPFKTIIVLTIILLIIGDVGFRLTTFVVGFFKHKNLSCHGSGDDGYCPHCEEAEESDS